MIPVIDCHAHLADRRIAGDISDIIFECREHSLVRTLANAARLQEWNDILKATAFLECDAAIGIHPFFAEQWNDDARTQMLKVLADKKYHVAAIGEIGLDCWEGRAALPLQIPAFTEQLAIARQHNLPVCIHNRKSWQDFFSILDTLSITELRGYCHNYTGGREIARKILDLGLHISFASPLTYPNAKRLRDTAGYVPVESILTETDCPDLPPRFMRGQLTKPWHASFVLQTLAEVQNTPIEAMAAQILKNYDALFRPHSEC